MVAGDDAAVAREEEVGQRREHVSRLVERFGDRAGRLVAPLDEHSHRAAGVQLADVARQRLGRDDVHRLANQQVARLGVGEDVGEERAHLVNGREPLENRDEAAVLALGGLGLDDVVVEVVGPVAWRYGEQFGPGRMHETPRKRPISDDTWAGMRSKLTLPRPLVQPDALHLTCE